MLRHDYEQEHEHDGLRREPAPFNRGPTGSAPVVQRSPPRSPLGRGETKVRARYELRR